MELSEQMEEGFRAEFSPLLDKGGSRRGVLRPEEKIFEEFMTDTAAFQIDAETDQRDESKHSFTSETFSGFLTKGEMLKAMASTIPQSADLTFCGKSIKTPS